MSLSSIYELYKTMEQENILLSFKGVVTSDLMTSILQIMESKMSYLEESPKIRKKVFNVLVECLQNLYHHIDESEPGYESRNELWDARSAVFLIAREEDYFHIRTGNYIDKYSAEALTLKLEKINGMDRDALKVHYQEVLNTGDISGKGTAGLGLIDIARKSGNKLEYEMIPINDFNLFFCLNVRI